MNDKTKVKKWAGIAVIALVMLFVFNACFSSSSEAAERVPTMKVTVTREGPLTITRVYGSSWCPEYPNGVLAGWIYSFRQFSPPPMGIEQYEWGPWIGSFCSNSKRVWGVEWGGKPDGNPNSGLNWVWHSGDSFKNHIDNTGTTRGRRWNGHFSVSIGPFTRHDYPWLDVRITTNAQIDTTSACGCDF